MCINGRRLSVVVNVISNECNESTSCLVHPIGTHGGEVMYFGCVCFRGELGFLNCICMCVMNKQFELIECVFDSVYVDLQYDEISLTSTVLVPYVDAVVAVTVMHILLFVYTKKESVRVRG